MKREKANAADTSTTPIEEPAAATKEHQPSTLEDICTLGAVELVRLVREREITAVEVVEAFLSRQAELDPHLQAFCTPTPQLARVAAKKVEADLAREADRWSPCGASGGDQRLDCH
jgi:hypothetical protein